MTRCSQKIVYYKRKHALKAAKEIRLKGQRVYVYQCPVCQFYHLSSRDHKRKKYVIRTLGMEFWV